jgi:hypothetical protein
VAKMAVKFESKKFYLVCSVILRLFIVLRVWKLSGGQFLFNFNFELMLLFIGDFKIVLERFRSSPLHYRYNMDGSNLGEGLSQDTVRLF